MNAMVPKDTSERLEKIYIEKLKQKKDIERALMGFSMFETARCLVKANLPLNKMTPQAVKMAIFNRFYGNDFDQRAKERIIKYLSKN